MVLEHTPSGSRPLPGVRLRVSEYPSSEISFITSDVEGRYETTMSQRSSVKVEPAPETGYFSPCPAGGLTPLYQPTLHVVHRDVLATTGAPELLHQISLHVIGRIVGPAPSRSPIAGASVELDNFGMPLSTTLSDAQGQYLLCSFPPGSGTDQDAIVRVQHPGYHDAEQTATMGLGRPPVDIELVPK
jgi:hypothetical protein